MIGRESMSLEDLKIFNRSKTIEELEMQRYNAQEMFYRSILDGESAEMREKYLNAWKISSDIYHARKWNQK